MARYRNGKRNSLLIAGLLGTILFSYQNCGSGFEVKSPEQLAGEFSSELLAPQHVIATASAKQGNDLVFQISIPNPMAGALNLSYETVDDTAIAKQDYNPTRGTVTIPAGSTSAEVRVRSRLQAYKSNDTKMKLRVFTGPSSAPIKLAEAEGQIASALDTLKLKAVFLKEYHSCGISMTDTAFCWGANDSGQLGDGSTRASSRPRPVTGLTGVRHMAVSYSNSCAVLVGGTVHCWGDNSIGQLGNGTTVNSLTPVQVSGISGAVSVAVNNGQFWAITATGEVYTWGGSSAPGSSNPRLYTAAPVASVAQGNLAVAGGAVCYVAQTGGVLCSGQNGSGQLGVDPAVTPFSFDNFLAVPGVTTVVELVGGNSHFCARNTAGRVFCWGGLAVANVSDAVALSGASPNGSFQPVDIGAANVRGLAAGYGHTCAIQNNNTVNCWGSNTNGQLGNGNKINNSFPNAVTGLTGISQIVAGRLSTCAISSLTNEVRCWGASYYGELGPVTSISSPLPIDVPNVEKVLKLSTSRGFGPCYIGGDSSAQAQVYCRNSSGGFDVVNGTIGASQVVSGASFSCALIATNGGVKCWGDNFAGQLGNGNNTPFNDPQDVTGLTGVKAITAGHFHACAWTSTDSVKCWGYNLFQQLATTATPQSNLPLDVPGLTGIKDLSAGGNSTCAIAGTGKVMCWGVSPSMVTSPPANETVREVPGIDNALKVSVAVSYPTDHHLCALISGGGVRCWGENGSGQLGGGDRAVTQNSVAVANLGGVAKGIVVESGMSCAILTNDTVKCWGSNGAGAFGNDNGNSSLVPVNAFKGAVLKGFSFVSGLGVAITLDGTLKAAGNVASESLVPQLLVTPRP